MSTSLIISVVVVFALTYGLIATRRLQLVPIGRPAFALLGAVVMVAIGALSPEQAYSAIDGDTICLLLGMMLITVYCEDAGLLEQIAASTLSRCSSARALLVVLSLLSAGLSAVLVNDTVCLFLTPVVVGMCQRRRLPLGPYLIALATSANIGSAATLVGNPQNMIIAGRSGLSFLEFFIVAGPVALAALVLNTALLILFYGKKLGSCVFEREAAVAEMPAKRSGAGPCVVILVGVLAGFALGWHMGLVALGAAGLLVVWNRKDPSRVFARVDWSLLVFFCGLFVVVAALLRTGLVESLWGWAQPHTDVSSLSGLAVLTAAMTAGSNLVSNVPMILIAAPFAPDLGVGAAPWVLLSYIATVAGNLTLLGSVANIIVAERAREHYELGYGEYLKFGLVSTILCLVLGVALLSLQVSP